MPDTPSTSIVQKTIDSVAHFFTGPHRNLRISFAITLAALLVHNFPCLLGLLPKDMRDSVQTAAYIAIQGSLLAALAWAKQYNATGAGSQAKTPVDTKIGVATNYTAPSSFDVDHLIDAPHASVGSKMVVGGTEYTVTAIHMFSPQNASVADVYYQLSVSPPLASDPTGLDVFVRV